MGERDPTPEEMIAMTGCDKAANVDRCLIESCDTALESDDSNAMLNLAHAFYCLRAVLMRQWDNPAPEVQQYVGGALLRRAQILANTGRIQEAVRDYEEIEKRYGRNDDPELRKVVAGAYYEAGKLCCRQEDERGALLWFEKVVRRFLDDDEPVIAYHVASALSEQANIYADRKDFDTVRAIQQQIIQRWSDHENEEVLRLVAHTRFLQAYLLTTDPDTRHESLGQLDSAIEYADLKLGRFISSIQGAALARKCEVLFDLDRYDEGIAAASVYETRHRAACEASPPPGPADADYFRRNLHSVRLTRAQCLFMLKRYDEADDALAGIDVDYADLQQASAAQREFVVSVLSLRGIMRCVKGHPDDGLEIARRIMDGLGPDYEATVTPAIQDTVDTLAAHIDAAKGRQQQSPG